MNGFTGRNDRFADALNGNGKDARVMTNQTITINRRRWLRLMTALMGVMLLALQTVPALAGSISHASYADLSYQLGKEETGYEIGGVQSAPSSDVLAFGSLAAPSATALGSSQSIETLEDAVDRLRESQQPADEPVGTGDANDQETADAPTANEPEGDADLAQSAEPTLVVSDDFMGGDAALWTGEVEGNETFISEEDGGWYVMLVQPGLTLPVIATGEMMITDGALVADARFAGGGEGQMGVFGRSTVDSSTYYYCLVDVYGGAGCYLYEGGQWYEIFYRAPGEVTRYQMDRLILDIDGTTLTFLVNDEVVGSYTDAAVTGGSWGLATGCVEGYCVGNFDFVDVYDYGTGTAGNEVPMTTVVATDFSDAPADAFFTDQGDWGFADINDGWYTVSLAPGLYFPNMINGTESLSDGVMNADIAYNGDGAFGLIARHSINADGAASYYACFVTSAAFANCNLVVDDAWYEIEGSPGVEVALEEINRVAIGVMGDRLFFAVNGQVVTDVSDGTLQSGAMGFYHEAFSDATDHFSTFVDGVIVETIAGDGDAAAIGSDLNENDLGLYTDSGDWGFADFAYEGVYTVEMAPGWYFPNPIADTAFIEYGAMTTVVDFGGTGSTGLIARYQASDAGHSFNVCWVDTDAYAGCHVVVNGEWFSLGVTDQPLQLGEMTELSLLVNGPEITFIVDGAVVIEAVDDTLTGGDWGFFNEAFEGGEGFWTDTDLVIIEQFDAI